VVKTYNLFPQDQEPIPRGDTMISEEPRRSLLFGVNKGFCHLDRPPRSVSLMSVDTFSAKKDANWRGWDGRTMQHSHRHGNREIHDTIPLPSPLGRLRIVTYKNDCKRNICINVFRFSTCMSTGRDAGPPRPCPAVAEAFPKVSSQRRCFGRMLGGPCVRMGLARRGFWTACASL
jgi:hypothetical protein